MFVYSSTLNRCRLLKKRKKPKVHKFYCEERCPHQHIATEAPKYWCRLSPLQWAQPDRPEYWCRSSLPTTVGRSPMVLAQVPWSWPSWPSCMLGGQLCTFLRNKGLFKSQGVIIKWCAHCAFQPGEYEEMTTWQGNIRKEIDHFCFHTFPLSFLFSSFSFSSFLESIVLGLSFMILYFANF